VQQKIRNILKNIETLSYNITDLQKLKNKCQELEFLTKKSVPTDREGFVLQPAYTSTLAVQKAKLKRLKNSKWRIAKRYSSLDEIQTKRGRKKQEWRFRNRVGTKAERLRKVPLLKCGSLFILHVHF